MTGALTASSFNSGTLGSNATGTAVLYQRTGANVLNATSANSTNIGTLVTNQSQLDVTSAVTPGNQSDFYTFNFQGKQPLKLAFDNLTQTDNLRFQLLDSKGKVVADSAGTAAQQIAYVNLTTSKGLTAAAGQYSIRVNYAPISTKLNSQTYSIALYSGNVFTSSYQTNAVAQTSINSPLPVDNTLTYATNDAQLFTRQAFNSIGETASSAVNIGWISQNKSSLNVLSQLTSADSADYYHFTLQQGNNLKLAFNNTTASATQTGVRVQLLDASGLHVMADSGGTTAQKAAYAALTSSTGVSANPATYTVKVTYGQGANKSATQNYNFQVFSGTSYSNSYETIASAQTYGNAILQGNPNVAGFNARSATASYLNSASTGSAPNILAALTTLV
jgi:Bacterial pre-peptidase C-terminal domain